MAVMRNSIIFGGVDSADFGIYIGGEGTFNAPKRDVEMISIPGRNGAFALDKGRFENIEVTYSAFNHEPDLATFSAQLEAFRNAICSQKGYQRLTDTFHPDEYRMAAYIDGLEIKPIEYNTAATFDITFDCKPQRYLTSGEEPITIGEWHETETASGSIASFEAVEGDGVKSLVVDIEPYQSGSGTPSPDNVRPINGYDSVVVSRCGKNLLENNGTSGTVHGVEFTFNTDGTVTVNGTADALYDRQVNSSFLLPVGTYIFSGGAIGTGSTNMYIFIRKKNGSTQYVPLQNDTSKTFDVTDDAAYMGCSIRVNANQTYQNAIFKPMVRLASETDDTYEPYQGNTYTTDLSGTRYGGTLDVVSGVLTVDKICETFTSATLYGNYGADNAPLYYVDRPSGVLIKGYWIPIQNVTLLSNYFLKSAGLDDLHLQDGGIRTQANDAPARYYFRWDSATQASVNTAFASTPLQVVAELATPTTVQLTAQEVELLVGLNQVWANSGDVTVEYGTAPNVVINPTLFESSPMLEVEGYGAININGEVVSIQNEELGTIKISGSGGAGPSMPLDTTQLNNGDTIFYNSAPYVDVKVKAISGKLRITRNGAPTNGSCSISNISTNTAHVIVRPSETAFSKGTNKTVTTTVPLYVSVNDTVTSCTLTLTTSYTASTEKVTLSASWTSAPNTINTTNEYRHNQYYGDSTKSILPSPMYIDLDIGEAYGVIDNEPLSFDNIVTLPAELPKLKSGANTITLDNTITDLKVIPRWWKI